MTSDTKGIAIRYYSIMFKYAHSLTSIPLPNSTTYPLSCFFVSCTTIAYISNNLVYT